MKVDPDDDREEVRGRLLKLARFVSCLTSPAHTDQIPYRSLEDVRTRSLNICKLIIVQNGNKIHSGPRIKGRIERTGYADIGEEGTGYW